MARGEWGEKQEHFLIKGKHKMNGTEKRNWIILLLLAIFVSGIVVYFLYQNETPSVPPVIELTQTSPIATPTLSATSSPSPSPTASPTKTSTIESTSTSAPTSVPTLKPTRTLTPTPTNVPNFGLTHKIQPGQYLTGISLFYFGTGRKWFEIYEATNIKAGEGQYRKIEDPNLIFPDDWVVIPHRLR